MANEKTDAQQLREKPKPLTQTQCNVSIQSVTFCHRCGFTFSNRLVCPRCGHRNCPNCGDG